ncbi:MAG: AzlD domain-containing protein [Rhizobiaceae bacterium]|nr:AzlD domain-containing protein [Rhizobiaceae bacterium]
MDADIYIYLVIISMGIMVYATRIAGSELMSMFQITPRIEAILKSMAMSVLVAIVVSECMRGGLRECTAVLFAVVAMLVFKNSLIAMAIGIITAAAYSFLAT